MVITVLPKSKITAKYQITIPREVRDKVEVRPGEVVSVEVLSHDEILLRRYPRVADSLKVLIGGKRSGRTVPVEGLEGRIETR